MTLFGRFRRAKGWQPVSILIALFLVGIALTFVVLASRFPEPVQMVWPVPEDGKLLSWKEVVDATNAYRAGRSAQWGQLGDMLGGILNPILAFMSTIGLIFTVLVSVDQLNAARQATLVEHRRARRDARRSEEAALASNSLAALTALLEHARAATAHARSQQVAQRTIHQLEDDERELADLLERAFVHVRTKLHGEPYLPDRMADRQRQRDYDDAMR